MAELLRDLATARKFVAGSHQISHMDRYPIDGGTAGDPTPLDRAPYSQFDRDDAVMGFYQQVITVPQQNCHVIGDTKAACNARDRVEHRLKVEFRAADDRQHLADRRLILQRFRELMAALRELARARLFRLEQPRVLDGDHGLIGERFEEFDLSVGEGAGFPACDENRPNDLSLANHRYAEAAPVAARRCRLLLLVARIRGKVRDMHDRTSPDRTRHNRLVAQPHRKRALYRLHTLFGYTMEEDQVDQF